MDPIHGDPVYRHQASTTLNPLRPDSRGLHGSDIHMDIHRVMDKCWIWIGFYRIDGDGDGYEYLELDLHNLYKLNE